MKEVIAQTGQTVLDIAIQHCGDVETAYIIAQTNGFSIDSLLIPGQRLIVPNETNPIVVRGLQSLGAVPASGS